MAAKALSCAACSVSDTCGDGGVFGWSGAADAICTLETANMGSGVSTLALDTRKRRMLITWLPDALCAATVLVLDETWPAAARATVNAALIPPRESEPLIVRFAPLTISVRNCAGRETGVGRQGQRRQSGHVRRGHARAAQAWHSGRRMYVLYTLTPGASTCTAPLVPTRLLKLASAFDDE